MNGSEGYKTTHQTAKGSTLLAALILIGIMLIQIGVAVHNQTS